MTIALVDTSVLCELLRVPGRHQDPKKFGNEFVLKTGNGERFLLPLATIIETGNHIGQNGNGKQRRKTASKFVEMIQQAMEGTSPFSPTNWVTADELSAWLAEFPDWAVRGSGLGDLSIRSEWDAIRNRSPNRRVYIWSKDHHLSAFDSG